MPANSGSIIRIHGVEQIRKGHSSSILTGFGNVLKLMVTFLRELVNVQGESVFRGRSRDAHYSMRHPGYNHGAQIHTFLF
jgi:hypothetical protein